MTLHKLEVVFNRDFTLKEVEDLKDALYEFISQYESVTKLSLVEDLDLIVLDSE